MDLSGDLVELLPSRTGGGPQLVKGERPALQSPQRQVLVPPSTVDDDLDSVEEAARGAR